MRSKLVTLVVLSLVCLAGATFGQRRAAKKTVFTSTYTNIGRGCEEIDGENGSDGFSICSGPAGYQVRVYYSAASTQINAELRGKDDNFPLATLSLDFDKRKARLEWRLADGRPFAAILRVPTYADPSGDEQYFGKVNGQQLFIKGLKGHEKIDLTVDAKKPDANIKAREIADSAYLQQ
jgi:hypothetical protein